MSERRNIVVLGASFAGIYTAQHLMRHTVPALKVKHPNVQYHVYVINPTSHAYFRIASPRSSASTDRADAEKLFIDLDDVFKEFAGKEFTLVQAAATNVDTTERTVTYKKSDYLEQEKLSYHALVVATGTNTVEPAFSQHTDKPSTVEAIKRLNVKAASAKEIVIVGGGPTSVEYAGEIAEHINGKPSWFSTPKRKLKITLITGSSQLLPVLRPAIGKQAEQKLKHLGVDVVYNTRIANVEPSKDGRTTLTLANDERIEADLYVSGAGVTPNSSFLPSELLNDTGYLKVNNTLRVDGAGGRVYAVGDIASLTRNSVMDVYDGLPVALVNLKRDLISFNPQSPDATPSGKDRIFTPQPKEMQLVPIGSGGGVGAIMGFKLPNWAVWLIKSRDFFLTQGSLGLIKGDKVVKEYAWTKEEAVA